MTEEMLRDLPQDFDVEKLEAYYWENLKDALHDAVSHSENGNSLGVSLMLGCIRDAVDSIDAIKSFLDKQ